MDVTPELSSGANDNADVSGIVEGKGTVLGVTNIEKSITTGEAHNVSQIDSSMIVRDKVVFSSRPVEESPQVLKVIEIKGSAHEHEKGSETGSKGIVSGEDHCKASLDVIADDVVEETIGNTCKGIASPENRLKVRNQSHTRQQSPNVYVNQNSDLQKHFPCAEEKAENKSGKKSYASDIEKTCEIQTIAQINPGFEELKDESSCNDQRSCNDQSSSQSKMQARESQREICVTSLEKSSSEFSSSEEGDLTVDHSKKLRSDKNDREEEELILSTKNINAYNIDDDACNNTIECMEYIVHKEAADYTKNTQNDPTDTNEDTHSDNPECLPIILNVRGNANDLDNTQDANNSTCKDNVEKCDETAKSISSFSSQATDLLISLMDKTSMDKTDMRERDSARTSVPDVPLSTQLTNISSKQTECQLSSVTRTVSSLHNAEPSSKDEATNTNLKDVTILSSMGNSTILQQGGLCKPSIAPMQIDSTYDNERNNICGKRSSDDESSSPLHLHAQTNVKINASSDDTMRPRVMISIPRHSQSSSISGTINVTRSSTSLLSSIGNLNVGIRNVNYASNITETPTILVNTQRMRMSTTFMAKDKSQSTNPSSRILLIENSKNSHNSTVPAVPSQIISLNDCFHCTSSKFEGMNRQEILEAGLLRLSRKTRQDWTKPFRCNACGDEFHYEEFLSFHLKRNVFKMTYFCDVCSEGIIFTNKCTFWQHIMKEISNAEEYIQAVEKSRMSLISYIPPRLHEDSLVTSDNLSQSSVSCNSISSVTQSGINFHPSSVTQPGADFPQLSSLTHSGANSSHLSSTTQSGTNLSHSSGSTKSTLSTLQTSLTFSQPSVTCSDPSSPTLPKANISQSTGSENVVSVLKSIPDSSQSCATSVDSFPSEQSGANLSRLLGSHKNRFTVVKCPICKIEFPDVHLFKLHLQRTSPLTYSCSTCQMTLFNLCHLAAHKTIHIFEERKRHVICPECGETLPYSKAIFEHLDFCCHFNVCYRITCNCGQVLSSVNRAKLHILKKHIDLLFNCRICGKAFISIDLLYAHYRAKHPSSKCLISTVILCNLCQEICLNPVTLQSHVEREVSNYKLGKQRMYQCMLCSQAFSDSSKLNLHMENDHNHKPKRCTLCFALFKTRQNLVDHIVTKSCPRKLPNKLHVCIDCPSGINNEVRFENSQYAELFKLKNQIIMSSEKKESASRVTTSVTSSTPVMIKVVTSSSSTTTIATSSAITLTSSRNSYEILKNMPNSQAEAPRQSLPLEKRLPAIAPATNDGRKYQCHSCKICLIGLHNLEKHMSHHNSSELKTGRTHCVVCKKMIVDSSIRLHMEEHQKQGVIVCTLCHRRDFANLSLARDHSTNWCYYREEKDWGEVCFREKQACNTATVNNESEKDNSSFEDGSEVNEDSSMSSSNEKQPLLFPCLMCGLAFSSKCAKDEHVIRVHDGTRTLFFCSLCKKKRVRKAFHKKKMAYVHISRKHRIVGSLAISKLILEEEQNISSGQAIPVDVSGQGSTEDAPPPKRLRLEAEGTFLCGKCGFTDVKQDSFEQHIKIHNPKEEPQCPECGLCFTVKAALRKHLFAVHRIKNVDEYLKERGIDDDVEEFISDDEEMETTHVDVINVSDNGSEPKSSRPLKAKKHVSHSNNTLECNVCYKQFSCETVLKSHIRNHGMAFIRSRRHIKSHSLPEQG